MVQENGVITLELFFLAGPVAAPLQVINVAS